MAKKTTARKMTALKASKKRQANPKKALATSSKSNRKVKANLSLGASKSSRIIDMFSFSKSKELTRNNFSTTFELGDFRISIKNSAKDGQVTIHLKIDSRNFKFSGNTILSERAYNDLHHVIGHLISNVRKAAA